MSKRLIYLVLFALLGAFVMFQSCSDTPVTTEESTPMIGEAGTGFTNPNGYCATGTVYFDANLPEGINQLQLWAGVGNAASAILVGNVSFVNNGNGTMNVVYNINLPVMFPYVPTTLHFDIRTTLNGIPHTSNGNPIPGQFQYSATIDPPYTGPFEISNVPIPTGDGPFYAAAHASIVQFGGVEGFNFYLPNNQVSLQVQQGPYSGGPSYWKYKIIGAGFISTYDADGSGPLQPGEYLGWCVDIDHTMGVTTYPAQLFSSYEDLPSWLTGPGLLENPENLDKVNYLVNNFFVGQTIQPVSTCGVPIGLPAVLTYSDIQVAIWTLIENNTNYSGLSDWDPNRVRAILCDVNTNGDGFIPTCNQRIVFIVVPNTGNGISVQLVIGQPIIGEVQVPCTTQGQTAWADGRYGAQFNGKNWATYFMYKPVCP
jgi:hypothetical protein